MVTTKKTQICKVYSILKVSVMVLSKFSAQAGETNITFLKLSSSKAIDYTPREAMSNQRKQINTTFFKKISGFHI